VRRIAGATGLFAILTAIMTWPQVLVLSTHAVDDPDVFFNLWRLRWITHALSSRASLFDANIFHPERGVLAYSDALLVEGVLGAPLLHAGVPPVLLELLRVRLPAAVLTSASAYAGPGTVGPDVARVGMAYAGTVRIRRSITSARNAARPEVSTPSCGYTGLPEAELPSRAVRNRSLVVATCGYRNASEENNASYRRRYTELPKSPFPPLPMRNGDRPIIERAA